MFPACEGSPALRVRLTDQWRKVDIRNEKRWTLLEPLVLAVSKGTLWANRYPFSLRLPSLNFCHLQSKESEYISQGTLGQYRSWRLLSVHLSEKPSLRHTHTHTHTYTHLCTHTHGNSQPLDMNWCSSPACTAHTDLSSSTHTRDRCAHAWPTELHLLNRMLSRKSVPFSVRPLFFFFTALFSNFANI